MRTYAQDPAIYSIAGSAAEGLGRDVCDGNLMSRACLADGRRTTEYAAWSQAARRYRMSISRLQRSIQGTLGRQLHGCLSAGATQFPKARSCLLRPAARPTRVNEGERGRTTDEPWHGTIAMERTKEGVVICPSICIFRRYTHSKRVSIVVLFLFPMHK